MTNYENLDNAPRWKWWFLQLLYDKSLEASNIADITSQCFDADDLLTRFPESQNEGNYQ